MKANLILDYWDNEQRLVIIYISSYYQSMVDIQRKQIIACKHI